MMKQVPNRVNGVRSLPARRSTPTSPARGTLLLLPVCALLISGLPVAAAQTPHGTLRPISLDGLGNPSNYGFHRLYQFQGYLWTVSGNRAEGAIVYRSRDGETWEAVSEPGIDGDRANDSIVSLAWFKAANDPRNSKGKLYAATYCFRCDGEQAGGDLWRANADAGDRSDIVWENITKDAFGDARRQAFVGFVVFKDQLYVGTFNNNFPDASGSEIFRTATGDPGDWQVVAPKGMGDPQCNTDFHLNIVFGDHVYFGSEEAGCLGAKGGEIWRTDGNLIPPYDTLDGWEKVTFLPGFGRPYNNNIFGMDVFQGHFYAATWTWTAPGVEVFRAPVIPPHVGVTSVPFSFEQVNLSGFGDPRNSVNVSTVHLGDTLYVAGVDLATGGRGYFYRTGGGISTAEHIANWSEITAEGFPPPVGSGLLPLDGPFWLEVFKGKVYVAVEQGGHGADGRGQLWVYEPANVPILSVLAVTRCAEPGGQVTIDGTGFDDYQGDAYPMLNGWPISVVKWTDTQVVAVIPEDSKSGSIAVYRDGETSNGKYVTVRPNAALGSRKCVVP